jgi:hypothetical protein
MSKLSKEEATEVLGAAIAALILFFLKGYLLMLVMSWIFPMFILPYWKWLVITLTIGVFLDKSNGSSNS